MRSLVVICCLVMLIGCGGGTPTSASGATPEDAALEFAQALADGDATLAAAYWAYDAQARADNSDWDSFPPGQRSQIKNKLRESKTAELGSAKSTFAGEGELSASAAGETVTISRDGVAIAGVQVAKGGDGYQVLNWAPAS